MSNICGIDLGTTYSAISKLNSVGKPEIAPNGDGSRMIPSVIYFDDSKTWVGEIARNMSEIDHTRYVEIVKRYMGDEYYPHLVQNKRWTPEDLSAIILSKIKLDFENQYGKIDSCVITVPAYFDEVRRGATMNAAKKAGLNIIGIVNEPTAAGLFYATQFNISGKTVVFDLGGGTFDVTLLDVKTTSSAEKDIEIITSVGDHELGGKDFDIEIANFINEKYKEKFNTLYSETPEQYNHLLKVSELLKKDLSKLDIVKTSISGNKGTLTLEISRIEFEAMIAKYFAKIEMLIESALIEGNIQASDVKQVILVGGSSRLPLVEKSLKKIFFKSPMRVGNMDESVSLGATIYAALQTLNSDDALLDSKAKTEIGGIALTDVCNHSYGTLSVSYDEDIEKERLENTILIPKNTKLPYSITKTFYTISEGQTKIDISITQGESSYPDEVNILKQFEMSLPPNRPSSQPVEITYSYDRNQRMRCLFKDLNSGRSEVVEISAEDIESDESMNLDEFLNF